jgi:hypothetical protein
MARAANPRGLWRRYQELLHLASGVPEPWDKDIERQASVVWAELKALEAAHDARKAARPERRAAAKAERRARRRAS